MWLAGLIIVMFILGLFLEMLSSSPKPSVEWQFDTDSEPETTVVAAAEPLAPTTAH